MSLATLTFILTGLGILVTGYLAFIFWRDPAGGLRQTTHRAEFLPQVMTDRYIAMTLLAIAATLYRDLAVIAVLFTSFAFMGYADAYIYRRAGHPMAKHLASGIAATIVVIFALMALRTGVTA